MAKKRKRGRPYTGGADPVRVLGRVNESDWKRLKQAAARADKPFTRWALEILLRRASK